MQKITQIMLAQGFGGAERHFVDLTLELAQRGYTVQAIHHADFDYQDKLNGHPNIHTVPVRVMGSWDPLAAWKIKRSIAGFAPDIVHTHLARGAHLGGQAARSLGIPCAVNLHNYVKLKYYHNIDHFIVATRDQRRYLMEHGIADEHITFMPHFSPLQALAPPTLQHGQPIHFITLGRMVKKKGFDVLIQAFRHYLDAGKQGHLTIGGDGPEKSALLNLIAQLGLQSHVTLAGWVDKVGEFLPRGDVFVLPSLDEPFGIVVLEAMACGRPIIATRTKGPVEILEPQLTYFVDIGDTATLTQAMLEVSNVPTEAAQKAQLASTLYISEYSADAVVPRVEAVYRTMLERR